MAPLNCNILLNVEVTGLLLFESHSFVVSSSYQGKVFWKKYKYKLWVAKTGFIKYDLEIFLSYFLHAVLDETHELQQFPLFSCSIFLLYVFSFWFFKKATDKKNWVGGHLSYSCQLRTPDNTHTTHIVSYVGQTVLCPVELDTFLQEGRLWKGRLAVV